MLHQNGLSAQLDHTIDKLPTSSLARTTVHGPRLRRQAPKLIVVSAGYSIKATNSTGSANARVDRRWMTASTDQLQSIVPAFVWLPIRHDNMVL